jgi:hypothetical protein
LTTAIAPNESAYTSASATVYAKITNGGVSSSAISVTLTVIQKPNLTINNPAAVCSPNTVDLTAGGITTGSTLPSGTALTYFTDAAATTAVSTPTAVGAGTYYIKAAYSNSPNCPDIKAVTVIVNTTPAAPVLSVVNNCNNTSTITAKDGANVNIPSGELTWSDGGSGNPRNVGAGNYTATRTVSNCTSSASNQVTAAPKTNPAAPVLSKVDNCNGTTTITAKDGSNVNIPSGELTWSNAMTGNPIVVNTTTSVTATRTVNGCTSGNSGSITPAPGTTPGTVVLSIVNPTCSTSHGNITVTSPVGAGYEYSYNGGGYSSSAGPYSFVAGAGYSITVRAVGTTCTNSASCAAEVIPTAPTSRISVSEIPASLDSKTTVKAYPNPFSDRVKFMVTSSAAGNGNLEIYNMMGQKIKTVYQGYIAAGTQTFELSLPGKQVANLVYVLRVGDKKVTGKILQMNQ